MAINFLNTINFNQNELQNVVIDPTGSAPTTTEGAMYYDTTDDIMYYRNASAWVPMDGSGTGVTSLALATGTSTGAPLAISSGTGAITLTSNAYNGTSNIGYVPTGGSATTFLRGDGTWVVPTDLNYTYALSVGAVAANESTLSLVGAGGGSTTTAKFSGTTDEIEITTPSTGDGGDITIGLPAAVTITTSLTVNSGAAATRSSFGYHVTIPETPLVDTDAASKGYVDGLVEGGLQFKGTFDANDGEIVSGSLSGSYLYQLTGSAFDPAAERVEVEIGDYYVVATAGDFYGDSGTGTCSPTRPMTIGDSIIAVADAAEDASVCATWSIVESDVGVTSVTASAVNDELGLIISPTTGAVVAGIDIKGTTNLGAEPATDDELLLYDTDGDVNKAVTIANLASAVVNRKGSRLPLNISTTNVIQQVGPPAGTEGWEIACDDEFGITSALDVMVEVITSGGETVYADVTRSGGDMTINFVGSGIAQGTYEAILSTVV